jgi:ribosomal protein L29
MTKKTSLTNHTPEELHKLVAEKREDLRALRFASSGGKNRNVKQGKNLRKEVARALTELSLRKQRAPSTT